MDVGLHCSHPAQAPPPPPVFLTRRILLIVGSQPPRENFISLPALNLLFCGLWFVSGGTPKSLVETLIVAHKLFVDQEAKRGGILLSLLMPVVSWCLN